MIRLPGACAVALAVLTCAGCVSPTPYQPRDGSDGYSDVRVDANTFHVAFKGNTATPRQTVETYLLYRCAEVTADAGFDYFTSLSPNTQQQVHVSATPGTSMTTVGTDKKGRVFVDTVYFPGTVTYSNSYEGTVLIKAYKGTKPEENPCAFNAKDVLQHMEPSIRRKP